MAKNSLGGVSKERPLLMWLRKLKGKFAAQGTSVSGYEEHGPYHCGDCIHKTAPGEPFCVHPAVIADPKMKPKLVTIDGQTVARINLKRGCCFFVNQPPEVEGKESEYEEDEE
jgi:hypothetical protein